MMEILNYSLWFTLVWWVFVVYVTEITKATNRDDFKIALEALLVPNIVMLLEYLLVR